MSTEYIFTMVKVSKFYGAERKVLDDITLAFLPGAKIGVLGVNGAGKSTLLRMMAGREEPASGHADLRAGADGIAGGPPPFGKADRSRFLQELDRALIGLRRSAA